MPDKSPPHAPLPITDALVTALITEQFPDLAGRDIGRHYKMEDHVSVRIGDDHGAIFPTVPGRDEFYERVAPMIAPLLSHWTFPISAPVRTGTPGHGFPYHWVVVPWISASTAAFVPLRSSAAAPLGAALRELHLDAPANAPRSPRSPHSMAELRNEWQELLAYVTELGAPEQRSVKADVAAALWDSAASAAGPRRLAWIHGNLEPRAILSDQGKFAGVLLWHCFGAGDPAIDLGAAAVLVPTEAREQLFSAYGTISSDVMARIQGYELFAALSYIKGGDPFRARLAWERLIELDLVYEP